MTSSSRPEHWTVEGDVKAYQALRHEAGKLWEKVPGIARSNVDFKGNMIKAQELSGYKLEDVARMTGLVRNGGR